MRAPPQSQPDSPTPETPVAAVLRSGSRVEALLALQRTIGNAATGAYLARQAVDAPAAPAAGTASDSWTEGEIRAVQRQLRRLRLYDLLIDGDLGRFTELGLMEAFGSEEWRQLDAATVTQRLTAATRPGGGSGRTLRYAELFRDGVFDVTFGMGYKEASIPEEEFNERSQTAVLEGEVVRLLTERGFTEDAELAARLLSEAGRAVDDPGYGRWFVKENATTYSPPAGESRSIHAVVRTLRNTERGGGGRARAAFTEAMTRGDAAFYTGHGRYGTGPDFDRNFLQFRIYDPPGQPPVQTIDDYDVLEGVLRPHGNPWAVFRQWVADGRLEVDFSNAGNLRLVATTPHRSEFGGALMQWALEQQQGGSAVATGAGGELATAAAASGRTYRLLAFAGCRTQDYERALRSTPGFGVRDADVLETTRTVSAGYGAYVFAAFVDSVLGQVSTQRLTQAANQAMREHEPGFSGDPIVVTGRAGPRS
jgi:hypothetical protein